jgi:tetratricopeptide (TPR) repeat protein
MPYAGLQEAKNLFSRIVNLLKGQLNDEKQAKADFGEIPKLKAQLRKKPSPELARLLDSLPPSVTYSISYDEFQKTKDLFYKTRGLLAAQLREEADAEQRRQEKMAEIHHVISGGILGAILGTIAGGLLFFLGWFNEYLYSGHLGTTDDMGIVLAGGCGIWSIISAIVWYVRRVKNGHSGVGGFFVGLIVGAIGSGITALISGAIGGVAGGAVFAGIGSAILGAIIGAIDDGHNAQFGGVTGGIFGVVFGGIGAAFQSGIFGNTEVYTALIIIGGLGVVGGAAVGIIKSGAPKTGMVIGLLALAAVIGFAGIASYTPALANAEAYLERGDAFREQGEEKKARADYRRAIQLNPNYAEAYLKLEDYDQAIKLKPDYAEAYLKRGEETIRWAKKYGTHGEDWGSAAKKKYRMDWVDVIDKAIADYDQAIALNPDYTEAYTSRAAAYIDKKDPDKAIADYNQVIKREPNNSSAYFSRGLVYLNNKEYDKAITDYDQVIKLSPKNSGAYNNRGLAYYNKKNYVRAIADYEAALQINPNSNARTNLEKARDEQGR